MYECMRVCVPVCACVLLGARACVPVCVCARACVSMPVSVRLCAYVHPCVRDSACVRACVCNSACVYPLLCVLICVHDRRLSMKVYAWERFRPHVYAGLSSLTAHIRTGTPDPKHTTTHAVKFTHPATPKHIPLPLSLPCSTRRPVS